MKSVQRGRQGPHITQVEVIITRNPPFCLCVEAGSVALWQLKEGLNLSLGASYLIHGI